MKANFQTRLSRNGDKFTAEFDEQTKNWTITITYDNDEGVERTFVVIRLGTGNEDFQEFNRHSRFRMEENPNNFPFPQEQNIFYYIFSFLDENNNIQFLCSHPYFSKSFIYDPNIEDLKEQIAMDDEGYEYDANE
jgi:hypothetical protein